MSPLLKRVTVLLLTIFRSAAAPPSNNVTSNANIEDVCMSPKTLSDPWRNLGFLFSELGPARSIDDSKLEEGWYTFTGIGGDRLVSSCMMIMELGPGNSSIPCNSSETFFIYSCNGSYSRCSITEKLIPALDCGGGKVIYYLVPIKGIYTTRHSSCRTTSCGVHAHCDLTNGNCRCESGFIVPDDFLPTGDLYGCSDLNSTVYRNCQVDQTVECTLELLNEILNSTVEELPQEIVKRYLNTTMYLTACVINDSMDPDDLKFFGNALLNANQKLVSTLVRKSDAYSDISFSVQNLEVQVLTVGTNTSFTETFQLTASNVSMDIDLIGISNNNNGSAAVAFLSYTNMDTVLKPSFFSTTASAAKVGMMSAVVSATLPKTASTNLTKAVNFTFRHLSESYPEGLRSCVCWKTKEWHEDGCIVTESNSTHTVCRCDHVSTTALIIHTASCVTNVQMLGSVGLGIEVAIELELFFLALSLLSLVFCCRQRKLTNTALINVCINLFLWEFFNLVTEQYRCSINVYKKLCAAMAGMRHLFGLFSFMWMLNEAMLLLVFVKNLSSITSDRWEGFSLKWLVVIGYLIPLVIVGVSVLLFPHGYDDKICWMNMETGLLYTFHYAFIFVVVLIAILYACIIAILTVTLIRMKNENLRRSNNSDMQLITSVMLKSLTQFFVLGCTWLIELFPNADDVVQDAVLFVSLQQGFFIFLVHCLLNQEVRQQYRKLLCDLWRFKNCGSSVDLGGSQTTVSTITGQ